MNTQKIGNVIIGLSELSRGLVRQVARVRNDGALTEAEFDYFMEGVQDALAGVEGARVALQQARRRLRSPRAASH